MKQRLDNIEQNNLTVITSFLSGMVVYYDFIIYLMFSQIITEIFFKTVNAYHLAYTFFIFAVGYIIRPLGGIIIANFGDKVSRRFMSLTSLFLMAIATVYIGTLPSQNTLGSLAPVMLMILRLIQGIGIGAELPAAMTMTYEHSPKNKKIYNSSFVFLGIECGILLATCVYFFLHKVLTPEELLVWGWRPPFLFGAILTAIVWSIRIKIEEPVNFKKLKSKNKIVKFPFGTLLKAYKMKVLIGFIIAFTLAIFISVYGLLLPEILHGNFRYSMQEAYWNNLIFAIFYVLLTLISSSILQKYQSLKFIFSIFATVILAASTFPMFNILASHSYIKILPFYFFVALSMGIISSLLPSFLADIFPTQIRFTGIATTYNLALALGGGLSLLFIDSFFTAEPYTHMLTSSLLATACVIMFITLLIYRQFKKH